MPDVLEALCEADRALDVALDADELLDAEEALEVVEACLDAKDPAEVAGSDLVD